MQKSKLLWHREIAPFTEPISINNTLYVGGQNVVYALDEKTGKERWHLQIDGDAMHLVPYQNKLFVKIGMYSNGKLLAIG
jgi:outer membrane protein assembly factor BamB